jgi:hypothetical protein
MLLVENDAARFNPAHGQRTSKLIQPPVPAENSESMESLAIYLVRP